MLFAKVEHPNAGYGFDVQACKDLNPDKYYEVDVVDMGQSHTTITLKDVKGWFNSVNFGFYKEVNGLKVSHDVYSDPEYNPYLSKNSMQAFD